VYFKAGSEILPVRSGAGIPSALTLSKLCAKQGMSQEPHHKGYGKALSVPFLHFKAGSEILPARSGAGKPSALTLSKLCAKQGMSQEPHRTGRGIALSVPFLCTLKLEVKLLQCIG
jgi:hypothetical protein